MKTFYRKPIYYIFLIFAFFPWISFRILDLDLQPYNILVACVVFLLSINIKVPTSLFFLLFFGVASLAVMLAYGVYDFLAIRGVLSYFSLFFISFSYFVIRSRCVFDILPFLVKVNMVWLLSGFFQLVFSKDLLSFLLIVRTTDDRGVTGLAPEPTFYGMYLIFLSWLIVKTKKYQFDDKWINVLLLLNLTSIFFIAKSSMAAFVVVLVLIIWFFVRFLTNIKSIFKVITFFTSVVVLCAFLPSILPEGSRISKMFEAVNLGPKIFFYSDASANERLKNIVFPIQLSMSSFITPHGYHSFAKDSLELEKQYLGYFWWGEQSNKIMSAWGALLYEIGFLSLPFFAWFLMSIAQVKNRRLFLFESISMLFIMLAAVPIALPIFSFIIMESFFINKNLVVKHDLSVKCY